MITYVDYIHTGSFSSPDVQPWYLDSLRADAHTAELGGNANSVVNDTIVHAQKHDVCLHTQVLS